MSDVALGPRDADLSRIFQALSDPTRPTGRRLPIVMRHLAVMGEAGMMATEKKGRSRLCHPGPKRLSHGHTWLWARRCAGQAQVGLLEVFGPDAFGAKHQTTANGPSVPDRSG